MSSALLDESCSLNNTVQAFIFFCENIWTTMYSLIFDTELTLQLLSLTISQIRIPGNIQPFVDWFYPFISLSHLTMDHLIPYEQKLLQFLMTQSHLPIFAFSISVEPSISTYRVPNHIFLSKIRTCHHLPSQYHFGGSEFPLQSPLAPNNTHHLFT